MPGENEQAIEYLFVSAPPPQVELSVVRATGVPNLAIFVFVTVPRGDEELPKHSTSIQKRALVRDALVVRYRVAV